MKRVTQLLVAHAGSRSGIQGDHYPRGRALGVTMFLPEEDRYSMSAQGIRSQIASLFGGRIAEEITLGAEHRQRAL